MSNENKQPDERAACEAALNARGNDKGQGLDPFWSSAFREGWQARALDGRVAYEQLKADYAGLKYLCARAETAAAEAQVELKTLRATQQATKGDERACTCNGVLGHSRSCQLFDESMMRATIPHPVAGSAGQAPMSQDPYAYAYEWDTPFGLHRDLQYGTYNGSYPNRTIALYTDAPTAPSLATDAGAGLSGHVIDESFLKWSEWTTELGEAISRKNIDGFVGELRALLAAHPEQRMSDAARDAERYRWIRNGYICIGRQSTLLMTGAALDDAIDAEIERQGGEA
ncbi:hypothetical protein [Paraburkholderia tropica]|uniref:hypothetical protein n=1 Tax=Paraburkholderia tropica TaxID=92647 RepID=UPI00159079DD|nr:hypothetical protein [Paraburkholderia tropica]